MKRNIILFLIAIYSFNINAICKDINPRISKASTYVDKHGVMRWSKDNKEVCLFGVNYNVPFSYWNIRKAIGANQYKAIDEDVYHISRLGVDGFRIHIWDCFISDTDGNLVNNEHMKLYDYLHYSLKKRGIKIYLTTMNLFTDVDSGFVSKYKGKLGTLSNPEAFKVMANYLKSFLNHVNSYTGLAYKDDPDVVALEIVNEPTHWKAPELITGFINQMYDAIRSTGCNKPIFYNMTTSSKYIDKVLPSKVEGGSFQWYPTGLTNNFELKGNYLPYVDNYYIPFDTDLKNSHRAKFIYEFSPADVGKAGYIFPAMARSFRENGFQFAAQFAYDELHEAYCNVEYRTHFMNLIYTPERAMGLMIANESFHEIPLYKTFGRYPNNNTFGSTTLNSDNQHAEFLSDTKFLYSGSTDSYPKEINKISKIAGIGDSRIVKYSGTGIYILDKIDKGVWRLEVMPDAFWVNDPFCVPYIDKEVSVAISREQNMRVSLPDLSSEFRIKGMNEGNSIDTKAQKDSFIVSPGVYLLTNAKIKSFNKWTPQTKFKNIYLGEYHIQNKRLQQTYIINNIPSEITVGGRKNISVKILSGNRPEKVEIIILTGSGPKTFLMSSISQYDYEVNLPNEYFNKEQLIKYYIQVKGEDGYTLFPGGKINESLLSRRIYDNDTKLDEHEPYHIRVVNSSYPLYLYDASEDCSQTIKSFRKDKLKFVPSDYINKSMVLLSSKDKSACKAVTYYCRKKVEERIEDIKHKNSIQIYASAYSKPSAYLRVNLIMRSGLSYGADIKVSNKKGIYSVTFTQLRKCDYLLQPEPYPYFKDMNFKSDFSNDKFKSDEIEKIQLSLSQKSLSDDDVALEWVRLVDE